MLFRTGSNADAAKVYLPLVRDGVGVEEDLRERGREQEVALVARLEQLVAAAAAEDKRQGRENAGIDDA
jgi:hypothetical protein